VKIVVIQLTTAGAYVRIVAKQLFVIVAVEETLLRAAENLQFKVSLKIV